MATRLGTAARQAREDANLNILDVALAASSNQSVVSRFERGDSWPRTVRQLEELVEVYERECGLEPDELWRRALSSRS